jgi:hypothetical protein
MSDEGLVKLENCYALVESVEVEPGILMGRLCEFKPDALASGIVYLYMDCSDGAESDANESDVIFEELHPSGMSYASPKR